MEEHGITKEEAVKILQGHRITFGCDFGWNTSVLEALDMAIDALSESTDEEIAKSFVEDVEAVKDLLNQSLEDAIDCS